MIVRVFVSLVYDVCKIIRGAANLNDEPTFLEDGYQLVPRTRQGASLNGCLGNNVELFPKKNFFFFLRASADRFGLGWVDKESKERQQK